jgi:hypothetical protein
VYYDQKSSEVGITHRQTSLNVPEKNYDVSGTGYQEELRGHQEPELVW